VTSSGFITSEKALNPRPKRGYETTSDEGTPGHCHVTGWGKPGGFTSLEETPDLAGVGCETCHGPGGTYLEPEYMSLKNKEYTKSDLVAVGLVGEITDAQCTSCHNADSPFVGEDFVFDFERSKNDGTHDRIPLKYEH
jgi:cytochrome c peroxidase